MISIRIVIRIAPTYKSYFQLNLFNLTDNKKKNLPSDFVRRIKLETAGVDKIPFWPINNREILFAPHIFTISSVASLQKYRPSPPTTSVDPTIESPFESKIH